MKSTLRAFSLVEALKDHTIQFSDYEIIARLIFEILKSRQMYSAKIVNGRRDIGVDL